MTPTKHNDNPETPAVSFETLNLHPELLKGIHDMGFIRPTPIQAQAIPPIMDGRDLIGLAQTGSGKTAAFVLPILTHLLNGKNTRNVRAMIISPTREIAQQSIEHLNSLSKYVPLVGVAIYGGVPMQPQIRALHGGVDIISATPGRLLDHIYSARIDFRDLQIFVLDEVDRMLDMGFLPDIQKIISFLPPKRQNVVFSATMPVTIQKLVNEILTNPVTVQIGRRSEAAAGIRHAIYPVPRHLKAALLLELLRGKDLTSVIVFTRTKRSADKLYTQLKRQGIKISVLHGDRSQSQRMHAMEQFRNGYSQVMVATDIAARGIDIDDISHVINYDIPGSPEDYVHRIGRTARGEDSTGDAFSLVSKDEEDMVQQIERAMKKSLPRVTLPDFDYKKPAPPKPAHGGHGGHGGDDRHRHSRGHSSHGSHHR